MKNEKAIYFNRHGVFTIGRTLRLRVNITLFRGDLTHGTHLERTVSPLLPGKTVTP